MFIVKKNILIGCLTVITLALAVLVVLMYTGKINLKKGECPPATCKECDIVVTPAADKECNIAKNDYNSIKGMYGTTNNNIDYDIYLYENGEFAYVVSGNSTKTVIGNYIFTDKEYTKLKLTYLMTVASQTEFTKPLYEYSEGTINSDGSITIENQPITNLTAKLTLNKISGEEEKKLLDSNAFNIYYLLKELVLAK